MEKLVLITGGARSGKSSFALELAESVGHKKLFLATCPSVDPEMSERVARHKQERTGRGWDTFECEIDLGCAFTERESQFEVILIDCLTLWINNILYNFEKKGQEVDDFIIKSLCSDWLDKARKFPGTIICVSNEVGLGIVPENRLARKYRDLVGTCNQYLGKCADEVVFVSCGIPLYLKK